LVLTVPGSNAALDVGEWDSAADVPVSREGYAVAVATTAEGAVVEVMATAETASL
jgi:hypothetical protein